MAKRTRKPDQLPLVPVARDKRLPPMARWALNALDDGATITLHHWMGRTEMAYRCSARTRGLRVGRRALTVVDGVGYRTVPWRDVYLLEEDDGSRVVNGRRLFDLPHRLAKELLSEEWEPSRSALDTHGSLVRAMASKPWGFSRASYAPTFIQQLDSRAAATRLKLAEWPDIDEPTPTPPRHSLIGRGRRDHNDAVYRETCAQLGVFPSAEDGGVARVIPPHALEDVNG